MIDLAPFVSKEEHLLYCSEAGIPFEENAVGFKIFDGEEKSGLCQLKIIGEAAYVLNLCSIRGNTPKDTLGNVLNAIVDFLVHVGIRSIVYPVQTELDPEIAEFCGFDRVSETMYVYDVPEDSENGTGESACECGCHHHH